jgi:small subunit ribosomal protein S6
MGVHGSIAPSGNPAGRSAAVKTGTKTMSLYEHVLITRPDISPQQVDALIEDITRILAEKGGKVGKTEYWGLRNLAYRMKKNRKAHYSMINIDAPADAVHELERRLRINEDVLRFLTVKVDALDDGPSPILARRERDEKKAKARAEEGGIY